MRMWYQAVRCSDGNKENDFQFGIDLGKNRNMDRRLAIRHTESSYEWDIDNKYYDSTWNYEASDCNFIFKGE
jgi:hypothetical protein